jgi:amidase
MKELSEAATVVNVDACASPVELSRRSFVAAAAGAVLVAALRGIPKASAATPDIDSLDAMGQAQLVRSGQVSALELLEACIARVERVNPRLNAITAQFLDRARAVAKGPLPSSPLAGVPYLIKDLVGFKGERMTAGSRLFADYISPDTSPAAEAAVKAGLVVFGKTNTCEFGLLPSTESVLLGPVHNPWNPEYSAGGSSGGAAAAVASGILPIAHATDAGGSIRMPASCCGVFGLKTSRFRVPNPDPMYGAPDVEFCVSRTVRDSAMMLSLSEDRRHRAPWAPVGFVAGPAAKRLKIAFCTQNIFGVQPDPEVKAAIEATAKLCRSLGHEIIEVSNPVNGTQLMDQIMTIWCTPAQWAVGMAQRRHLNPQDVLEPWTLGLAALLSTQPKSAVKDAIKYFKSFEGQFEQFIAPYDVWLTPVLFSPPPRLGELAPTVPFDTLRQRVSQYVSYTPIHNVAGGPAMSVPLHWSSGGLPIGSQFAAKGGGEASLLSLAYELEIAQPWAARRPPISAVSG